MNITVAILAGGSSKRFGSEKALAIFQGKSLISHMIDIARQISSDVIVVVANRNMQDTLSTIVPSQRIVTDPKDRPRCALSGALTAFQSSNTHSTLLLPVDAPLAHPDLLKHLIHHSRGYDAVVPSWSSGFIEPLHAVYSADEAYQVGTCLMENKRLRMSDLLDQLRHVLYIPTDILSKYDPSLDTFTNFNTPEELDAVESKLGKKEDWSIPLIERRT